MISIIVTVIAAKTGGNKIVNRKQRRALQKGKLKGSNLNNQKQAQEMLENLPIATIVAGINNSLDKEECQFGTGTKKSGNCIG